MKRLFIALGLICIIVLSVVTLGFSDECRGDLDGNGVADGADLAEFALDYGSSECPVKTVKYIICEGDLSTGGRWCDNADGTVTDMTTGLVWLKDASWGGQKAWRCKASYPWCSHDYDDARTRAGILKDGMAGAGLSDGSVEGDWRLPTKSELVGIAQGDEAVTYYTSYWFTGVISYYWSSTTRALNTDHAWNVLMCYGGCVYGNHKANTYYVWPVRGGN